MFEKNFERKLVNTERYFRQLIYYIHNNPVQHGFVKQMSLYPWSSYGTNISNQPSKLKREPVHELFEDKNNFIGYHLQQQNMAEISNLIIEY